MTFDLDDTICAIASALGGALCGIIRISGPQSLHFVAQVCRPVEQRDFMACRKPSCISVVASLSDNLGDISARLYLWPTVKSYTRQPSAELHLPGSPPILEAAIQALCRTGARLARPGEFTLRALLAGRLDLTQAEAVLGVIDAQSRAELDTALGQLAGGLALPLAALREELLDLLAHLEAGLDFADEDIAFISSAQLIHQLQDIACRVNDLEIRMQARGESGSSPRVVVLGLPNTGKSSLFNALSENAVAIVSDVAGTTRDFVVRRVSLGGQDSLLIDTAGVQLELDQAAVESLAQQMTRGQAQQADLMILCLDISRPLAAWECEQLTSPPLRPRLVVWTKCDLPILANVSEAPGAIFTSSVTRQGLDIVRGEIVRQLAQAPSEAGVVAGTADRCRESLRLASTSLSRALGAVQTTGGDELAAAELRIALEELGRVAGAVFTEDILDRIFSRFCIGK